MDDRPVHEIVSANIIRIADEKNIPLTEVADRAGMDRREFFAVLEGSKEGDLAWINTVARALGVGTAAMLAE